MGTAMHKSGRAVCWAAALVLVALGCHGDSKQEHWQNGAWQCKNSGSTVASSACEGQDLGEAAVVSETAKLSAQLSDKYPASGGSKEKFGCRVARRLKLEKCFKNSSKGKNRKTGGRKRSGSKCFIRHEKGFTSALKGTLDCGGGHKSTLAGYAGKGRLPGRDPNEFCPDDLTRGRFWAMTPVGKSRCFSFLHLNGLTGSSVVGGNIKRRLIWDQKRQRWGRRKGKRAKPQFCTWAKSAVEKSWCEKNRMLITKAQLVHPNKAGGHDGRTVIGLALKRIARCPKINGVYQCRSVFKKGLCLDCAAVQNPMANCSFVPTKPPRGSHVSQRTRRDSDGNVLIRGDLDQNQKVCKPIGWGRRPFGGKFARRHGCRKKRQLCLPRCKWYQHGKNCLHPSPKCKARAQSRLRKKCSRIANKWFWSNHQSGTQQSELKVAGYYCIAAAYDYSPEEYWSNDFKPKGPLKIKGEFRCNKNDMWRFKEFLKAY